MKPHIKKDSNEQMQRRERIANRMRDMRQRGLSNRFIWQCFYGK